MFTICPGTDHRLNQRHDLSYHLDIHTPSPLLRASVFASLALTVGRTLLLDLKPYLPS